MPRRGVRGRAGGMTPDCVQTVHVSPPRRGSVNKAAQGLAASNHASSIPSEYNRVCKKGSYNVSRSK